MENTLNFKMRFSKHKQHTKYENINLFLNAVVSLMIKKQQLHTCYVKLNIGFMI